MAVLRRLSEKAGLGVRPDGECITASVGIAVFPDEAGEWRDLVKLADERMYQAKRAGGNAVFPKPEEGDMILPEDEDDHVVEILQERRMSA